MSAYDALKAILVEQLRVPAVVVTPEATKDDLDLDSLAVAELVAILQEERGLNLDEGEIAGAGTVQDIADLMLTRGWADQAARQ
jgi:acyl carrier protein